MTSSRIVPKVSQKVVLNKPYPLCGVWYINMSLEYINLKEVLQAIITMCHAQHMISGKHYRGRDKTRTSLTFLEKILLFTDRREKM